MSDRREVITLNAERDPRPIAHTGRHAQTVFMSFHDSSEPAFIDGGHRFESDRRPDAHGDSTADGSSTVDEAMNASFDSLMALHAVQANLMSLSMLASSGSHAEEVIGAAIEAVRSLIAELQALTSPPADGPLVLGFVRGVRMSREPGSPG